jgi:hypothetical protein
MIRCLSFICRFLKTVLPTTLVLTIGSKFCLGLFAGQIEFRTFSQKSHQQKSLQKKKNSQKKGGIRERINYLEQTYKIPKGLLRCIATIESKCNPWVVNDRGKTKIFTNKRKMDTFIEQMKKRGIRNVSVGCMQLHLGSHLNKFRNVSDFTEPENNIKYAAKMLVSLYRKHGSWKTAVARYHTGSPCLGSRYANRVFQIWHHKKYVT